MTLPIPEEAPKEFPRLIATSPNNHSQMAISNDRISLSTRYDSEYWNNWDMCRGYMDERVRLADEMVRLLGAKILFRGIVLRLCWEESEPVTLLEDKFLKCRGDYHDLALKLTKSTNDDIYKNIMLSSVRGYPNAPFDDRLPGTFIGIEAMIDVNTRLASNYRRQSSLGALDLLMQLNTIVSLDILSLIKEGIWR